METNVIILIVGVLILSILISVYVSGILYAPDKTIDFTKDVTGLEVITKISPILKQNMNNLILNLEKSTPESLKNDLKTNLENALKSVKILDPKNLSKQADAISSKIKQVDAIKPEDTQALKSLQQLTTESSLLIEDVPNTTDNILQTQIDKISSLTSSNINEIRNKIIPEVSKTLQDLVNSLKSSTDTQFSDLSNRLQSQINLLNNFTAQYKIDSDALRVLVSTSIQTARNDLTTFINTEIAKIVAVNQKQDRDISDINSRMTSKDTQITNILTRSIPEMNKLILDLQNKQITDVTTLNTRLDSINNSLTKSITDLTTKQSSDISTLNQSITDLTTKQASDVNTFNQNISDIQASISSLRNDNNRRFDDISSLINSNISVLTNAVNSLSSLVSSDINALYSAFNNMKNTVETQKIVINTPQNRRWTIAGDSDGRLCIGNPNPVTCIDNVGNLVAPVNTTSELNNVVSVPAIPTLSYNNISSSFPNSLPDLLSNIMNKSPSIFTDSQKLVEQLDTIIPNTVNLPDFLKFMIYCLNDMILLICPNKTIIDYAKLKRNENNQFQFNNLLNNILFTFVNSKIPSEIQKRNLIDKMNAYTLLQIKEFINLSFYDRISNQVTIFKSDIPNFNLPITQKLLFTGSTFDSNDQIKITFDNNLYQRSVSALLSTPNASANIDNVLNTCAF